MASKYLSKDEVHEILEAPNLISVDGIIKDDSIDENKPDIYKDIIDIINSSNTPKTGQMKKLEDFLSPMGKSLLNGVAPETRKRYIKQLLKDNLTIEDLKEKDDLYSPFEELDIALFLEYWVCDQMKCECGSKFIKYESLNQPIVDIRCSNLAHSNMYGPKYYQIKTTQGQIVRGYKYFSADHIFVGSINMGYNAHNIKPSELTEDSNLIGYICITYERLNEKEIKLLKDKSFMVIPKMTDIPEDKLDELYYEYIDLSRHKPAIQYSKDLNEIKPFPKDIKIDISITFNTKSINLLDSKIVKKIFTDDDIPFVDEEYITQILNIKDPIKIREILNEYSKKNIKRIKCPECNLYEVNNVMIPCGHLLCNECIKRVKDCPICKKNVENKYNIYFMKYMKYKSKYMKLKNTIKY